GITSADSLWSGDGGFGYTPAPAADATDPWSQLVSQGASGGGGMNVPTSAMDSLIKSITGGAGKAYDFLTSPLGKAAATGGKGLFGGLSPLEMGAASAPILA